MILTHTALRSGRLSSFLLGELGLSAGRMNKLKWGDAILVNGEKRFMDYNLEPGDVISVDLREDAPEYPAQDGPLDILYEDDFLLAVDKPAGMLIHPSRCKNTGTLANLVAGYYRRTGQGCAFHPLTRLDRDTFGVVLLGKNAHVHSLLQKSQVQKTYHALVLTGPQENRGIIDAPIARREAPSLLRYVSPEGKRSVTQFQVLERSGQLCRLSLTPVTGRTHQLRVHCAYRGFPILGDPQYCTAQSLAISREMGLSSQALCAHSLELRHPLTGEKTVIPSKMDVFLSGTEKDKKVVVSSGKMM